MIKSDFSHHQMKRGQVIPRELAKLAALERGPSLLTAPHTLVSPQQPPLLSQSFDTSNVSHETSLLRNIQSVFSAFLIKEGSGSQSAESSLEETSTLENTMGMWGHKDPKLQ